MSRKPGGFWSNLLGYQAPREKFSLEQLQHLHEILRSNAVVTDQNRDSVVEALRASAELMIWGDQHDPRFFEFFLENNLMRHFTQFLQKAANRRGEVAKQVLQTLYILIQNIRSQTAIYYIFSNNHVNDIITLPFDFEDDEVLGYYINLVKTISLRLTSKTVQLFFQDDGEHMSFPLYTEAIKFINHRDGMVRAAVRTLTLNVYSIDDAAIRQFLVSTPASNYFNELSIVIAEQCQALDRRLPSLEAGTSNAAYSVETDLADIEDMLSYCNDILCTGDARLSRMLMQCLWDSFIRPTLVEPLQQLVDPSQLTGGVGPLCSLCILERLMHTINHAELANSIAAALVLRQQAALPPDGDAEGEDSNSGWQPSGSCREGLLTALRCGETVLAAAAVRLILALIQNRVLDPDTLDSCGLLPQRQRKTKQLLDMLTAEEAAANSGRASPGALFADRRRERSSGQPLAAGEGQKTQRSRSDPSHSLVGRNSSLLERASGASEWTDALCELLGLQLLPCTALWVVGHLLIQLLAQPKTGSAVTAAQQEMLATALRRARAVVAEQMEGVWADALPLLLSFEWDRAAANLGASSLQSTTAAVQAWMQAIQAQKLALEVGTETASGKSARAAAVAVHTVQQLAALLQIYQGLMAGSATPQLPIIAASELQMKRSEVREGMQLTLQQPAMCTVSFARGAERTVLFAVYGVPQVGFSQAALSAEEQTAVASSAPCVLLASPGSEPDAGVVLSVAPLIGSEAYIDSTHKRWLHIRVRPNARGMLKTIRGSGMGEAMHHVEKQLVDGHWVLSFEAPELTKGALETVRQQSALMKQLLHAVLSPLLT